MASFNSLIFLTLLVAVSTLMAAPSAVEAGDDRDYAINVTGTVPCAVNSTFSRNGTLLGPRFPNATVQLRCGKTNMTVATNTTDGNGKFSFFLPSDEGLVKTFINSTKIEKNCTAVVTTPLSTCNSTLPPNGTLQSPLTNGPDYKDGDTKVFVLLAKMFKYYSNQTI